MFDTSPGGDFYFTLNFSNVGPTPEELAALVAAEQARLAAAAAAQEAAEVNAFAQSSAATGTSARLLVIGADGVVRDAGQVSLATRDNQLVLTRVAGSSDVTASTSGAPGMMGGVYTWVEITGFTSDTFGSGDGSVTGRGLQIGADMAIGPDMVAGLSLGYSTVETGDTGISTEGTYTYLQPYFAYRSGAWAGNASLIYGVGDIEQTSTAGTGEADVTFTALTFEGGYDYALSDALTVTPTVGLVYGREQTEGTSGILAGRDSDVTFGQVSLGARMTYATDAGTLFAGLHAEYLSNETEFDLAQDFLADDGWTGRLELGADMALSGGLDLSTSVELSGLGGDMQTVSGALRVAFRF
ncbi:autotransporter outer membrane beta-barrel domain-containing protein [Jannaschia sp. CCS1]|uniref:autotransporter outer membrane beta-barrel domain-containing protein n=1 Tax=Jannaschia sp. (strain CCS1) TaxID=290400 RepID=UPI00031D991B|nr:autotransporter outer membrane beta-barrel domain-containing protein [Jannaschia sp. CCS1]